MNDVDMITVDTASDDLWAGQQRIGINLHGRVERVTLVEQLPCGSVDGWRFRDDHGTCDSNQAMWVATDNVAARWPMIAAGQLRKPAAPSLEVYQAVTKERARILAQWAEEQGLLGDGDPLCEAMCQLQP